MVESRRILFESRAALMRERNRPRNGSYNWEWREANKKAAVRYLDACFKVRRLRWWRPDERDFYNGYYAPNFKRELAQISALVKRR